MHDLGHRSKESLLPMMPVRSPRSSENSRLKLKTRTVQSRREMSARNHQTKRRKKSGVFGMVERRVSTSQSRRRRLPVFARFFLPLLLLLPLFLAHDDRSERAGLCGSFLFCCVRFYFTSPGAPPCPPVPVLKFFCMHEEKFSPFHPGAPPQPTAYTLLMCACEVHS